MKNRIAVLGSANADYSMRTETIPLPGETLAGRDFQLALGGKGANQAMACARLGGAVDFIACVGNDAAGKLALTAYAEAEINLEHVHVVDIPTGSALIFVADSGENSIGVAPGANAALTPTHVDAANQTIHAADYLLMQLESPIETLTHAATLASASNTCVVLNPAPARSLPEALLRHVDVLTPNQTELATLTDQPTDSAEAIQSAARSLLDRGLKTIIVTLGAAGALVVSRDTCTEVAAPSVTPLDTTGAGDTFNGALLVGLAERRTLVEAVQFANRAAALSVTRRGAIDSIPSRVEVDGFQ
ncbi:MAG: ribokinase [Pseudomonadota bacterium]